MKSTMSKPNIRPDHIQRISYNFQQNNHVVYHQWSNAKGWWGQPAPEIDTNPDFIVARGFSQLKERGLIDNTCEVADGIYQHATMSSTGSLVYGLIHTTSRVIEWGYLASKPEGAASSEIPALHQCMKQLCTELDIDKATQIKIMGCINQRASQLDVTTLENILGQ